MPIITYSDLKQIRKKHSKIAFCSGCYDILHSGHVVFFRQCKEFTDTLVVSIGRDSVIKRLKGDNRPINPENNRAYLLSQLRDVDYVILGDEEVIMPGKLDFINILKQLRPDYFILNEDDSAIEIKKKLCDELGIELKLVPRTVPDNLKKTSSTEIIDKLINSKGY